jgi:hypothetical protein
VFKRCKHAAIFTPSVPKTRGIDAEDRIFLKEEVVPTCTSLLPMLATKIAEKFGDLRFAPGLPGSLGSFCLLLEVKSC